MYAVYATCVLCTLCVLGLTGFVCAPNALTQRGCVPNYNMPAYLLVHENPHEQNRSDFRADSAGIFVKSATRKRLCGFARAEIGEIRTRIS